MDYLSDSSLRTLHIMSKQFLGGVLPDFVKNADIANEKPVPKAPLSVYGNPVNRQFPCHSKVATWLSTLYLLGTSAKWDSVYPREKVADRLEKAAAFWGILPEIQRLKTTITEKSAAPDRKLTEDDYALVVNYGQERVRRFPIVNAVAVKKAAANIHQFRTSYPYVWRKKAALNILRKAMEFKADLPLLHLDYLLKASGVYPAEREKIAAQLKARAVLFPDDVRDRMRKAAAVIPTTTTVKIDVLCDLLDNIDRHYKKYAMYNAGLAMPEEICYAGITSMQKAAAASSIQLTTGSSFAIEDLKRAGLEPFTVLAPDYVQAVTSNDRGELDMAKVAEVLPTLPKDDAQIFERALTAKGIHPMEKEARVNLNQELSMDGWASLLGPAVDKDFAATFKPTYPQRVHEKLAQKQSQGK